MMIKEQTSHDGASQVTATSIWGSQLRWLTLGLVLTVVGTAFEALAVGTILPVTVRDLGGLSLYGWVFSAYLLTNMIGLTIGGGEADRRGLATPSSSASACLGLAWWRAGSRRPCRS